MIDGHEVIADYSLLIEEHVQDIGRKKVIR